MRFSTYTIAANIGAALVLAACTTTDDPPPSYQVAASLETTKQAMVEVYAMDGFTVSSDSQFQIAFDRFRGGTAFRHSYTLTGSRPVTAIGSIYIVDNPGSAFERISNFTNVKQPRAVMDNYMRQVQLKASPQ